MSAATGRCRDCGGTYPLILDRVEGHEPGGPALTGRIPATAVLCRGAWQYPAGAARTTEPGSARETHPCAADCGRPVTASDWAVRHAPTGRWWHAWCWHAVEAPGQGDLLDLLAVAR